MSGYDSTGGLDQPADRPERFADDQHRYRLDARIATGGMGEVWRATDTSLDRVVAIKLLKSEYADDPLFRQRFETEARHAASLHHPNVASVYDVGESRQLGDLDGSDVPRPFLVMELIDGQPLSALLRGGRPLDPDVTSDLMAQAADAIGAAHRAGIVHRDVKPANLMVTPQRQVKITDFGIARASDGLGLTGTGQVMGTPQYLSPEQARGNAATPASDVYSLGVVAFECLVGRRPFDAESPVATALAHLNDPVPTLPATVPPDVAAVVRRALSKDPAERYADGAAFADALRRPGAAAADAAATQVVAPPTETTQVMGAVPPRPVPPPTDIAPLPTPVPAYDDDRRSPWPIVLLLLALVAAVALIAFLVTRGGGDDETAGDPTPSATRTAPSRTPSETPTEEPTEQTSEPEPETVTIDEDDYLGDDLQDVVDELRGLDLQVKTNEVENPGDEEQETVSSVDPDGELEVGDTVTVSFYGEPPEEEPTPTPTPTPTPSDTPSQTPTPSDTATPAGPGNGNGNGPGDGGPGSNGNGNGPGGGGPGGPGPRTDAPTTGATPDSPGDLPTDTTSGATS